MPWIENVSLGDIPRGRHHNAGENSMLIQIVDPAMEFPTPMHKFKEVHQFEFLDVEEKDEVLEEAMKCSHEQAAELVRLLQHALDNRMNVVVHCVAGVCRSGAVCELGKGDPGGVQGCARVREGEPLHIASSLLSTVTYSCISTLHEQPSQIPHPPITISRLQRILAEINW